MKYKDFSNCRYKNDVLSGVTRSIMIQQRIPDFGVRRLNCVYEAIDAATSNCLCNLRSITEYL